MKATRARLGWGMSLWALLIGLLACGSEARSAEAVPGEKPGVEWQSVELAKAGGVTVRLLVKKEASAADESWMKIEYENTTDGDVSIVDPHYRIDYEAFDLATGKPLRSGGLASGGAFDASLVASRGGTDPTIILPPGKHEISEQPSNYSTALLDAPPKTGLRIKATAIFWAKAPDRMRLGSLDHGANFEFNWLFPDESSIEGMRQRLKAMLGHRQSTYHETYLLGALLSFPGVGDALDIADVLQGFRIRKGAVDGRQTIAKYINTRRADDPQTKEFFLQALKDADSSSLEDLAYFAPNVWDDQFVGPLVQICKETRYRDPLARALKCLDRHSEEWKDDGTTPALLSNAVMRLSPTVVKRPEDLTEKNGLYWGGLARRLAMTHDRGAVPFLRQFLGSTVVVHRFDWDAVRPSPVPARACDVAYNAIQAILGNRDKKIDLQDWSGRSHIPQRFGPEATARLSPEEAAEVQKELGRRDALIRGLQASLDAQ